MNVKGPEDEYELELGADIDAKGVPSEEEQVEVEPEEKLEEASEE